MIATVQSDMLVTIAVTLSTQTSGQNISLQVDGMTRTAIVYRPSVAQVAHPAVYFVFHGLGANANEADLQFRIQNLDNHAIVIYAQGLPAIGGEPENATWRPGQRAGRPGTNGQGIARKNTWQIVPGQYRDRDIHFVQALMDWADKNGADPTLRYCMGHSNGSMFSWVILKELGDKFAAFAGLEGGSWFDLAGAPKRPAFLSSGSRDQLAKPESILKCANALVRNNGCGPGKGSPVKVFSGPNPVVLAGYEGGHLPPKSIYEMAVKFCQTGKVD